MLAEAQKNDPCTADKKKQTSIEEEISLQIRLYEKD